MKLPVWLGGEKTQEWYVRKLDKLTKLRRSYKARHKKLMEFIYSDKYASKPNIQLDVNSRLEIMQEAIIEIDSKIKRYHNEAISKGFKIPEEIMIRMSE